MEIGSLRCTLLTYLTSYNFICTWLFVIIFLLFNYLHLSKGISYDFHLLFIPVMFMLCCFMFLLSFIFFNIISMHTDLHPIKLLIFSAEVICFIAVQSSILCVEDNNYFKQDTFNTFRYDLCHLIQILQFIWGMPYLSDVCTLSYWSTLSEIIF